MSDFSLHPRLEADTYHVTDLALCQVRLMNDARFPWVILVPRRAAIREVYELEESEQARLWQEATMLGRGMQETLGGDKLNLATLGNLVAQLHLHVIVRRQGDDAWPGPVWGAGTPRPYSREALEEINDRLLALIASIFDDD
ncbi:HIT domain-containing protein [Halomonas sp. M20]|uniref:HIT domain-containing protein n=1 Tax=Halomonas sp. M20 TaxID=2763264 RepID=UPI001D0A5F7C|nr:HIT domain-containing protein [Halomonas sp. M20]